MVIILASIGILVIFWSKAKDKGHNRFLWALLGLITFWATGIVPAYVLIEYGIGHRNDAFGVILIIVVIFGFLTTGALACRRLYKHLEKN